MGFGPVGPGWTCAALLGAALLGPVLPGTEAKGQQPAVPVKPAPAAQPATPPAGAPEDAPPAQYIPEPLPAPTGQVLFQSHGQPPSPETDAPPAPMQTPQFEAKDSTETAVPDVSDEERNALRFTGYDLLAIVTPATHGMNVRAVLTVRNDGTKPMRHLALQVSSSFQWLHAALENADKSLTNLPLAQHRLDTDADHTGAATEALIALPEPLAPGRSLTLSVVYEGKVEASAARLVRLGAAEGQARTADWDEIGGEGGLPVALRGFGNVLWYPVASPQVFLGNGAELFQAAGRMKLREQGATVRLRLSLDASDGPMPAAVYFCGRRAELRRAGGEGGVAEAEFKAEPLGFRPMSLFVLPAPERLVSAAEADDAARGVGGDGSPAAGAAPPDASSSSSSSSSSASLPPSAPASASRSMKSAGAALQRRVGAGDTEDPLLAVETTDVGALPGLAASVGRVAPLLTEWLGERPLSALTVVDHPGQPFEDGPLLIGPAESLAVAAAAPAMAHSLTHAWVQTGQPWMDEGLAQFMALLEVERDRGRDVALAQLQELMQPVTMAEVSPVKPGSVAEPSSGAAEPPTGQPLVEATDEFFFRRKAAAVWWMLRDIAGEPGLHAALSAWRVLPVSQKPAEAQAQEFAALLNRTSGKDLQWFFDDWVLHDRGLPDLSIVDVSARAMEASNGERRGWLTIITLRNDGGAQAEVPLEVRAGSFANSRRVRVPAFGTVTERVEIEAPPTEVRLNDGSVPEVRSTLHTRTVTVTTR